MVDAVMTENGTLLRSDCGSPNIAWHVLENSNGNPNNARHVMEKGLEVRHYYICGLKTKGISWTLLEVRNNQSTNTCSAVHFGKVIVYSIRPQKNTIMGSVVVKLALI